MVTSIIMRLLILWCLLQRTLTLSFHSTSTSTVSLHASSYMTEQYPSSLLPKLVVFDLDNTLWSPELYTLRKLPGYSDASGAGPIAGADVQLFTATKMILEEVTVDPRWKETRFAVASRTNKGKWARSLLKQFVIPKTTRSLDDFFE